MRVNLRLFIGTLAAESGLMAPLLLAVAVLSVVVAASAAKSATTNIVTRVRNPADSTVALVKSPIGKDELEHSAERLSKLAPGVRIAVTPHDVVVSIHVAEQFPEFLYALTALQSMATDVVWEPKEVCLNSCDGGDVARARVGGFTQALRQVDARRPPEKS